MDFKNLEYTNNIEFLSGENLIAVREPLFNGGFEYSIIHTQIHELEFVPALGLAMYANVTDQLLQSFERRESLSETYMGEVFWDESRKQIWIKKGNKWTYIDDELLVKRFFIMYLETEHWEKVNVPPDSIVVVDQKEDRTDWYITTSKLFAENSETNHISFGQLTKTIINNTYKMAPRLHSQTTEIFFP